MAHCPSSRRRETHHPVTFLIQERGDILRENVLPWKLVREGSMMGLGLQNAWQVTCHM